MLRNLQKTVKTYLKPGRLLDLSYQTNREPRYALVINNQTIEDQTIVANQFNNRFCAIGARLAEKII